MTDELDEPLEAVRLNRLRESGAGNEHEIVPFRKRVTPINRLAQLALEPITLDGAAELLRHGDADATAFAFANIPMNVVGAVKTVHNHEPMLRRPSVAIHPLEVCRAGESLPTRRRVSHADQALSLRRPAPRRRLSTRRPARVDIRLRKPCLRDRRRVLG